MESWRMVWREGIAPQLSTAGLRALRRALLDNDPALVQGTATLPPPLHCNREEPVCGACSVGYCCWKGDGLTRVGAVQERVADACRDADILLGQPAEYRWFLNWFDDAPRDEMRRLLLAEVQLVLARRVPVASPVRCVPELTAA